MNRYNMSRMLVGAALAALATAWMTTGAGAQTSVTPASSVVASQTMSGSTNSKEAKAANRKLQKDVSRVLARTKGLSVTNITVRADAGNVTLEGTVPEESQIDLATNAAKDVPGVASVKNTLALSTF